MGRKLILVAVFMLLSLAARSQAFLYIDSNLVIAPVTSINDTLNIAVQVLAEDQSGTPVSFSGFINYWVLTDSMMLAGVSPRMIDSSGVIASIQPGNPHNDVVSYVLNEVPGEIREGINVIIVWPSFNGGSGRAHDSIQVVIDISGPLSLEPQLFAAELLVFPNPAERVLYLQNSSEIQVERVRLLSVRGDVLREASGAGAALSEIVLEGIPPGLYLLEVRLAGGNVQVLKFLRK